LLAFMESRRSDEPGSADEPDRNREWFPDDRYIDVLVGQRASSAGARHREIIATIHGTGYLFTPEVV
jgi:DNA-binding response OmpR family regulator